MHIHVKKMRWNSSLKQPQPQHTTFPGDSPGPRGFPMLFSVLIEGEVGISFAVLSALLTMLVLKMRLYSSAVDLSGKDLRINTNFVFVYVQFCLCKP